MNAVQYREAVEMARELCQLCGETPDAGDGVNASDSSFSGIVYANAETKATGPRIDFGYTPYPDDEYDLSDLAAVIDGYYRNCGTTPEGRY